MVSEIFEEKIKKLSDQELKEEFKTILTAGAGSRRSGKTGMVLAAHSAIMAEADKRNLDLFES